MEKLTRNEFINKHLPTVLNATKNTGIFPETVFTIAIIESQAKDATNNYFPGLSILAQQANNYFGIKADPSWKGKTITVNTPNDAIKTSKFRSYNSFNESVKDFIKFLKTNPRYTNAGVFNAANHVQQLVSIAKAGYAESPNYQNLLIQVSNKINEVIKENQKKVKPMTLITFSLSLIALIIILNYDPISRKIPTI
jgi:mannosyl-glycoprotein endo-beta-N-acetylglucosaminidase/stage II sporulation protein P